MLEPGRLLYPEPWSTVEDIVRTTPVEDDVATREAFQEAHQSCDMCMKSIF